MGRLVFLLVLSALGIYSSDAQEAVTHENPIFQNPIETSEDLQTGETKLREHLIKLGYTPGSGPVKRGLDFNDLDQLIKKGQRLKKKQRVREGKKIGDEVGILDNSILEQLEGTNGKIIKLGPKSQRVIIAGGGVPLVVTQSLPVPGVRVEVVEEEILEDDLPPLHHRGIGAHKHYKKKRKYHRKHPYYKNKHDDHYHHHGRPAHADSYNHGHHDYVDSYHHGHHDHVDDYYDPYSREKDHHYVPDYHYNDDNYLYDQYGQKEEPYYDPHGYAEEPYDYPPLEYGDTAPEYRHQKPKDYEYYVHVKSGAEDHPHEPVHHPAPHQYDPHPPPPAQYLPKYHDHHDPYPNQHDPYQQQHHPYPNQHDPYHRPYNPYPAKEEYPQKSYNSYNDPYSYHYQKQDPYPKKDPYLKQKPYQKPQFKIKEVYRENVTPTYVPSSHQHLRQLPRQAVYPSDQPYKQSLTTQPYTPAPAPPTYPSYSPTTPTYQPQVFRHRSLAYPKLPQLPKLSAARQQAPVHEDGFTHLLEALPPDPSLGDLPPPPAASVGQAGGPLLQGGGPLLQGGVPPQPAAVRIEGEAVPVQAPSTPVDGEAFGEDLVGGFHHHTGPFGAFGFYANFFDDEKRVISL